MLTSLWLYRFQSTPGFNREEQEFENAKFVQELNETNYETRTTLRRVPFFATFRTQIDK